MIHGLTYSSSDVSIDTSSGNRAHFRVISTHTRTYIGSFFVADLIVCNRVTAVVRASARSWVEFEVRRGPGNLEANVKVDSRPMSRVEQAELAHVLAALDATEEMLKQV